MLGSLSCKGEAFDSRLFGDCEIVAIYLSETLIIIALQASLHFVANVDIKKALIQYFLTFFSISVVVSIVEKKKWSSPIQSSSG